MTPAKTLLPTLFCLVLAGAVAAAPEEQQRRQIEGVEPGEEQWLRQQLRKVEGWGVNQLLRTERRLDREQKRRANVSSNPQELAQLADDEDRGVRFFVASNPNTPLGTLVRLADDPEVAVRSGVALALRYDPRASAVTRQVVSDLATRLATDGHVLVRLALVEGKSLPPAAFDSLQLDPDFVVRRKLAGNNDAPRAVLTGLAADPDSSVRIAALMHRNLPIPVLVEAAGDASVRIRKAVCANINAPLTMLDSLATDPEPQVRRLVARHPNTPLRTLWALARDADPEVLIAVAEHRHADRTLLSELADDDRDARVRVAAQDRLKPLLRNEIRDDILERWQVE